MSKGFLSSLLILSLCLIAQGCTREYDAKNFVPGVYEAKSSADDDGGYGVAKVTIKNRKIVDVDYHTYTEDGKLKDVDYGKIHGEASNKDYYDKAQFAVASQQKYVKQLLDVQNINMVDGITGASIIYSQFKESIGLTLDQAEQKFDLSKLKDGTYSGKSTEANSHHGDYATVDLTIKDHKIVDLKFNAYMKDGSIKDQNYGKHTGKHKHKKPEEEQALENMTEEQRKEAELKRKQHDEQHYELAQKAIQQHSKYVQQLMETQDLGRVDAITGATRSYDQFVEATSQALSKAKAK